MTSDELQVDAVEVVEAPGDDESLIDPETGWNRLMVNQIVRDIQIAHSVAEHSWSVMPFETAPDVLILSVGGIWVASIDRGSTGRLLIDAEGLTPEQRANFSSKLKPRTLVTEGMYNAHDLWFSLDTISPALASLSGNHEQLVREQAGRASRGSTPERWFRERLMTELERITGQSLPRPGFITTFNWLKDSFDLDLLRYLADDIDRAHSLKPTSWALYSLRADCTMVDGMAGFVDAPWVFP